MTRSNYKEDLKYISYLKRTNKWIVRTKSGYHGVFTTLGEALDARDEALREEGLTLTPIQELIQKYGLTRLMNTPLDDLAVFEEDDQLIDIPGIVIEAVSRDSKVDREKPPEVMGPRDPFLYTATEEPPGVILVFGDNHIPYHHPDMLAFLCEVKKLFPPDLIVNLGDEIDSNAMSFYPMHPDLKNATDELKASRVVLREMDEILIGGTPILSAESNHTSRMYRKAKAAGIPKDLILSYEKALGVDWNWHKDLLIPLPNGTTLYATHTKGSNTLMAGQSIGSNIIAGHYHKRGGTMWWTNATLQEFFAASNPCLIDFNNVAYSYDENTMLRPNLGCTVIVNSYPLIIPMKVDRNNRWTGEVF